MVWGITGYTAGGRMPLNNALRAGQFRTGTVNFFQRPINIQNNFYGGMGIGVGMYAPYDDGGTSSTMKWATRLAIGGGVLSALGNIFGAIWGGNKSEGAGGASKVEETNQEDPDTSAVAALRDAYKKQCTISDKTSLGYVISDLKTPGKVDFAKDLNELKAKLAQLYPASEEKAKVDDEPKVEQQKVEQPKEDPIAKAKSAIEGLYTQNGLSKDSLVSAEDLDKFLTDAKGKGVGVYDHKEGIGSFNKAQFSSVRQDGDKTFVKIGNREYQVIDQGDGFVYLKDTNPTGGDKNKQVYILEKDSTGTYSLNQRDFLGDKTIGFGKPAETSRPKYWGIA